MRWRYDPRRKAEGLDPWIPADRLPPEAYVQVIEDTHRPFRSQLDGKMYDSKSTYRKTLKSAGKEEVGGDISAFKPPKHESTQAEIVESYKKARYDLGYGYF